MNSAQFFFVFFFVSVGYLMDDMHGAIVGFAIASGLILFATVAEAFRE